MDSRIPVAALVCVLLGGPSPWASPAGAQQPGQPPPERATPLLSVDFAAVTRDGTPVPDLQPGEITIRIGNRSRTVRTLQALASAEAALDGAALPPPFGTNVLDAPGREFVVAIDEDSFRPGREAPLRAAVERFAGQLGARDRVSLVTMPYGGIKVPFTTEHARVSTALAQIVGRAPTDQTGSSLACRTRDTLTALGTYLTTLGVRTRPVTVILVTAGLAAPRHDAPLTLAPGICELRSELFEEVGVMAGAARARVYLVQPGDTPERMATLSRENIAGTGFTGSDNPVEGIEHLAGVTGGKMLQLTGSEETALGRILRETSRTYVAAFDADPNDRTGRPQQLDVRVNRPGIEVRAARHITFARPERTLTALEEPSPREMLSTLREFRDLPLRTAAFTPVDDDPAMMRVVTLTEPVEPGAMLASLVAALFDRDGKAVAQWVATDAELQQRPIVGAMRVPAGAYRLRVAAIDRTGRAGTADYEVNLDVATSGPLKLSSLVLGLSRDGAFAPRLQFTTEPVALGYVEMAGAAAGTQVTATLEVAHSANGPAIVAVPLAIEGAGPNRYTARGAIPIGALPPGDYIVRAMVGVEGHPATRVIRTLRKAVPASASR